MPERSGDGSLTLALQWHTAVQAAALPWLAVRHPHSISAGIRAGTTAVLLAVLLVPPPLACDDCFRFEDNLTYHRYTQGFFIRH